MTYESETKFLLSIVGILVILIVTGTAITMKEDKKIKDCFLMEIKTKDCEYLLWKEEHTQKNNTAVVPMPVIINR